MLCLALMRMMTCRDNATHTRLYTHVVRRRKQAKKGAKAGKTKTIARSNQGCHRTRVFCPRCKEEWGLSVQVRRRDRDGVGGPQRRRFCLRTHLSLHNPQTSYHPFQGLEPYTYNYFMMGLKSYICSTCLLTFGSLTAIHRCVVTWDMGRETVASKPRASH